MGKLKNGRRFYTIQLELEIPPDEVADDYFERLKASLKKSSYKATKIKKVGYIRHATKSKVSPL